jgi:hypothetical protein
MSGNRFSNRRLLTRKKGIIAVLKSLLGQNCKKLPEKGSLAFVDCV